MTKKKKPGAATGPVYDYGDDVAAGLPGVLDNGFPVDWPEGSRPWIEAVEAIDLRQDPEPLLKLFAEYLPPHATAVLGDLFKRKGLKARRGHGRDVPVYDMSPRDYLVELAVEDVDDRSSKQSKEDAIAQVADARKIHRDTLRKAVAGQRGVVRKRKLRRSKLAR